MSECEFFMQNKSAIPFIDLALFTMFYQQQNFTICQQEILMIMGKKRNIYDKGLNRDVLDNGSTELLHKLRCLFLHLENNM